MKVTCISDLHGFYPDLPEADLLIVAGDWCRNDHISEFFKFKSWLERCPFRKKIIVAGNHDNFVATAQSLEEISFSSLLEKNPSIEYLCDSGTTFEGFKIWGSPWTKTFDQINPKCTAFTVQTEEELSLKWRSIPADVDVLITHSPPYLIGDLVSRKENVGSIELRSIAKRINPILHVFGHVHEGYGIHQVEHDTAFINASHVNKYYTPKNQPITFEI